MEESTTAQTEESTKQIRGSSLLLIGRLFSLLANLMTQVLAVRYLTKADYGAFAFALVSIETVAYVSMLGLDKACARFLPIYHERHDHERALGTWIMSILTALAVSCLVIAAIVLSQDYLLGTFISSELSLELLLILLAWAPIESLDFIFEAFFGAFGNVKSVFYRRYILRPGLKLAAVVSVLLVHGTAKTLAWFYLGASLLGFAYYIPALIALLRNQNLLDPRHFQRLRFPVREVFAFTGPLVSSHLVFLCQSAIAILLLEAISGSEAVGEFRAVLPFARLNVVVLMCFILLYTPLASRFHSRNEPQNIAALFWDSTVWIVILSFPILAMTTVFSKPLTVFMLGEDYANASTLMTILAIGLFFEASLGLCSQTLRVYARIRYILIADAIATLVCITSFFVLVPRYAGVGAAIATSAFNVVGYFSYMIFTHTKTDVKTFKLRHPGMFATFAAALVLLAIARHYLEPGLFGALGLVFAVWLALCYLNRDAVAIDNAFPEISRIPLLGQFCAGRPAISSKK